MATSTRSASRLPVAAPAAALIAVLLAVLGWSATARAHTDFESSDPADGAAVGTPVGEIRIAFTNPASPSGEGFLVVDGAGTTRVPTAVDVVDESVFVLRFDPPLAAGSYGVRWQVQAADAHPIEGSFRFSVTTPATAATAPATTVAAPATTVTAPGTTVAAPIGSAVPDDPTLSGGPLARTSDGGAPDPVGPDRIDELLRADATGEAAVGRAGRAMSIGGTIFGLGALAALAWVIRGRRDELGTLVAWIRLAGLVVVAGGLLELGALQAARSIGLRALLDSEAGTAAVLKVLGGLAVWFGLPGRGDDRRAPARSLSAAAPRQLAADGGVAPAPSLPGDADEDSRWRPTRGTAVGVVGFALVVLSYTFDGHTASEGPRIVHAVVGSAHILAAAVWGGGVAAIAALAWSRRRRSERVGLAAMVVRFSSIAALSLGVVVLAGVAMAALILDAPGDLFSTPWGRALLIKTAAVAAVAGLGAFNHLRLRPRLERSPDDQGLLRELRISLALESVGFAVIVIVTAWLVGSAN